jgi:hypothetical protein
MNIFLIWDIQYHLMASPHKIADTLRYRMAEIYLTAQTYPRPKAAALISFRRAMKPIRARPARSSA